MAFAGILPQVEGETENIRVTSIVGRYLEHARIYCFGKDAEELMFISSADFMTRNMDHRVEVGCPIDSPQVRQKIHRIIELQRMDNTKARRMRSDGTYRRVTTGKLPIGAQDALMEDAMAAANLSGAGNRPSLVETPAPAHKGNRGSLHVEAASIFSHQPA